MNKTLSILAVIVVLCSGCYDMSETQSPPVAPSHLRGNAVTGYTLNGPLSIGGANVFQKNGFYSFAAAINNGQSAALNVISDSTANDDDEWVRGLAEQLAVEFPSHRVEYISFNPTSDNYNPAEVISDQPGPYIAFSTRGAWMENSAITMPSGDYEIVLKIMPTTWPLSADANLFGKFGLTNYRSIRVYLTSTELMGIEWYNDSSTKRTIVSTTALSATQNSVIYLKYTHDLDNGSSGTTISFYYSSDEVTWTQLGSSVVSAGVAAIYDVENEWELGARSDATNVFQGNIYWVKLNDGINGTPVNPVAIESWAPQDSTIDPVSGGKQITIINQSVAGAEAADFYTNGEFADGVVQKIGVNYGQTCTIVGAYMNAHTTTDEFLAQNGTLVSTFDDYFPSSTFVFMTENPRHSPAVTQYMANNRTKLIGWAVNNNHPIIDSYRWFVDDQRGVANLLDADGVHPNDSGEQLIVDGLIKLIKASY